MTETIVTTSWDDGHPRDMKLARLLKKYEIPGTFYIPIDNLERKNLTPDQTKSISKSFDIGGHTYYHKILTDLDKEEAYEEIVKGKEKLEQIIDKKLISFCYPSGRYNDDIKKMVKKAGFKLARTVKQLNYRFPKNPFEIKTTIHVGKNNIGHVMAYRKENLIDENLDLVFRSLLGYPFVQDFHKLSLKLIKYIKKKGGVFHLWGHSWEIEKNNCWNELELLLKKISKMDDVTLMTNSELVRYLK